MAGSGQLGSIVSRLESIAEDLDELAFDLLREAAADGEKRRPPGDKPLTQARRAVEKATELLRQLDGQT